MQAFIDAQVSGDRDALASLSAPAAQVVAGTPSGLSRGYLVSTDAWYPGWKAYVDGRPATLHRANLAFRAVSVPAGRHRVAFRYEPRSVRVGLALTALAGCIIAGMLVGAAVVAR